MYSKRHSTKQYRTLLASVLIVCSGQCSKLLHDYVVSSTLFASFLCKSCSSCRLLAGLGCRGLAFRDSCNKSYRGKAGRPSPRFEELQSLEAEAWRSHGMGRTPESLES